MKKLLLILFVLFCWIASYSQTKYPLPYDTVIVMKPNGVGYLKASKGIFLDTIFLSKMQFRDGNQVAGFVLTSDANGNIRLAAAGGAGSTNLNIGAGNRLAVFGTNNIKTVFSDITGHWDSASNANGLTYKVDSVVMSTRLMTKKQIDSLAAIIATKGTVTNIASGYGLTGGPITTTGTFKVDSNLLTTRLWHQKAIDSLSVANAGLYWALNGTSVIGGTTAIDYGSNSLDITSTTTSGASGTLRLSNTLSTGEYIRIFEGFAGTTPRLILQSANFDESNYSAVTITDQGINLDFDGTGTIAYQDDRSPFYTSRTLVDSAFVGSVANKYQPIGSVVSQTFSAGSIPSGFTQQTGAATITYPGGGVNLSVGNGSYSNNYIKSTYYSYSNNFQLKSEFTVNTKPFLDGDGLLLSKISGSNVPINLYVVFKKASSTTARLTMRVVNGAGNGTIFDSTSTVSLANTNKYRVTATSSNNTIYFKLALIAGGIETEVADKLFTIPINTAFVLPNVGSIGVGVLGGNYTVTLLEHTDYDVKYSDVLVIGTSITQGFYPTSIENHYLSKSFKGTNKRWVNYGSGGNTFLDITNAGLTEIYAAHPVAVGLELGVNDVCADIRTYAPAIIDSLQAHGIDVFWIQDFTSTCKDSVILNICNEQNIPLYAPGKTMTSDMFIGDLVHPNDLGFSYIAKFLKGAGPQYFGTTGSIDQYSYAGLKDIKLTSLANGDIPVWNSTTLQWNNGTGGSNFIQNQTSSSQLAGFKISGYGQALGYGAGGAVSGIEQFHGELTSTDGAGLYLKNNNATGINFINFFQAGTNGFGITPWSNSAVLQAGNSLVLNSYDGSIYFQTNNSSVTRMQITKFGQTAIGNPVSGICNACLLDLQSTIYGFLPPRMTTTQQDAVTSVDNGLFIYNTTRTEPRYYNGVAWAGVLSPPYIAKTTTYGILSTDYTIDCTSGTFTVTLPTAVSITGREYIIKNSGAGVITVATTSSQTIDGATTYSLPTQYKQVTIQSNGANWLVISNN